MPFVSSSSDPEETRSAEDITRTRTSVAAARDEGVIAPSTVAGAPHVPETIGRYRVTGYLGRGGMGMVLAAHDTELKRSVALKLLHPGAWGEKASSRIEREAQAMAKLSHPNVVTVYEVGRAGEQPFIAMEVVDGVTLREWLRGEKRSWRQTLEMMIAAGRGLAAAHAAGLVHRDFKPENVLVGRDGRPRVSDFGLVATTVDAGAEDSASGASVMGGTPGYMAPEQWVGGDVDARADQFAFAVSCWEALWGNRPFPRRDDIVGASAHREPERPRKRRRVPRRVEAALRQALQLDRTKRWPKLSELLDRLERAGRDRRPVVALVASVSIIAAVGAGFAMTQARDDDATACRTAGNDIDAVWGLERQRALEAAFGARPEPYAKEAWVDVQRTLEEWVMDYRDLRVQACQAGRTAPSGSAPFAVARAACLDRRRGELAALVAALAHPDLTTVQYARSASRGLTPPAACLAAQGDGPATAMPPIASRDALGALQRRLAEVSTLRALGKPREAVVAAEGLAKDADALGWGPVIAASQLELALSYQAANANADGERAHTRAALEADAARDDQIRFEAMLGLAVAGMDHSEYDKAGRAIETARMISRRLPPDERREVMVAYHDARLAFWRGEYDGCVARGQETLQRIAAVMGEGAVERAVLSEKVAHCLHKLDKYAEAEDMQRRSLEIAVAAVGREHPVVADAIFALGYAAANRGQLEEALRFFQEALAIRERVLGADNPVVGLSLTGIGHMQLFMGRLVEARASFERARAVIGASWGSDSPALAIAERFLGDVAMELEEFAVAERHYRQALEIYRVKRPPGHDELINAEAEVGRALLGKGDRDAIPFLRSATAAFAASPGVSPGRAATARRDLGRALVLFGDRGEGIALLREACSKLEGEKAYEHDLSICRRYLQEATQRRR